MIEHYELIRTEINFLTDEALKKPRLNSAQEVMASIIPEKKSVALPAIPDEEARQKIFAGAYETIIAAPKYGTTY